MLITKQNANNLASLVSYLLAIISVCLTAFNLYLVTWIWSATGGVQRTSQQQQQQHQEAALHFAGAFRSKHTLSAGSVSMNNQDGQQESNLQISSRRSLHIGSSLILSAQDQKIVFPAGFVVRNLNSSLPKTEFRCDISGSNQGQKCQLSSSKLRLTNENGVDFMRTSIQTRRVFAERLHSPTNKLQMMSLHRSSRFESAGGPLELHALADIQLGSTNSTVILNAKTIKLKPRQSNKDERGEFSSGKQGQNGENAYRLCVCLQDQTRESSRAARSIAGEKNSINNHANGLVFAIRSDLNCFKLTRTFCLKQSS